MSFMKKVAKIAAPFASLIPGVGPLIGAGLGLVGSLGGGNKKSSPQTPLGGNAFGTNPGANGTGFDPGLMTALVSGLDQTKRQAQTLFDTGTPLINQGAQGHSDLSSQFFSPLIRGGRQASNQILAPGIQDINTGYNSLVQQLGRGSRSGGTGAALMDLSNRRTNDIARLRFGAQANAAQGLQTSSSALLGGGSNLAASGLGGYQDVLSKILGIRGQDLTAKLTDDQLDAQAQSGLGEGIGSILGILLQPGGLLNKGKNKTPTSTPDLPILPGIKLEDIFKLPTRGIGG